MGSVWWVEVYCLGLNSKGLSPPKTLQPSYLTWFLSLLSITVVKTWRASNQPLYAHPWTSQFFYYSFDGIPCGALLVLGSALTHLHIDS